MLTLSWSDGNTLIPVNSCLLASAKDTNIIGPVKVAHSYYISPYSCIFKKSSLVNLTTLLSACNLPELSNYHI